MSDFQLGLLGFGVLVIVGVLVFNWWQERNHRRRAEEAFDVPARDILFEHEPIAAPEPPLPSPAAIALDAPPSEEPVHREPEIEVPPRAVRELPPVAAGEPDEAMVDCRAEFEQEEPFGDEFLVRLAQAISALSRPVRVMGLDDRSGLWVPVDEAASGRFRRIRTSVQLADRQAVISRTELDEFVGAMQAVADEAAVDLTASDTSIMEARAQELDNFCAEVDIAIGLSVVARGGHQFPGTTIRALAESAGLKLKPDGQFHFEDAQGQSQFTLDNQATEPFFPDSIKSLSTNGITFLLDVPRASGGIATFDRMVQVAKRFSSTLEGIIVDDNRNALSDNGLDAIRRHLSGVYAAMEKAGIPAGSATANRLFS